MSSGIPIIKFLFNTDFKVLNDSLQMSPAYEVEQVSNASELTTFMTAVPAGLVIASLREKNDLIQIATFMKGAKKTTPGMALKMVVINFTGDKQFEKAIAKLGIQDQIEPGINTKALKFKLDFWMKALSVQVKNNPASQQNVAKAAEAKKEEKKAVESQVPTWVEPLDLEDDIWILKQDADCKKILSKWLIRLMGPSPYVGQWTDVKNNMWRFDIKESEKEMYTPGTGAWFFFGDQKPDFVWKENIWLISGDAFDLFYKDGDKIYSRLKSKDKILTIAKNSLFAKTKETVIVESFDKELVFKKEAQALADLEGKGKTDAINGGPLSGKNKTSHLNRDPLSGEVNPEDALLNSDLLTQKAQNSKEKTHWKGINMYEQDQGGNLDAPAPEGVREGSELGLDQKNSDHQKHYKGHNPTEQFEGSSSDMSGKSSTDKMPGHYGRPGDKPFRDDESSPDLQGKGETDRLKAQYSRPEEKAFRDDESSPDLHGKNETDKLKSHYGKPGEVGASESKQEPYYGSKEVDSRGDGSFKDTTAKPKSRASLDYPMMDEEESTSPTRRQGRETDTQTNSTRTEMKRDRETQSGYGMDGASEADKSGTQYSSQAGASSNNNGRSSETPDPYADLFGKSKDKAANSGTQKRSELTPEMGFEDPTGSVISLDKARAEKNRDAQKEAASLEEMTSEAKMSSVLIQNQNQVASKLDDFFDDTVIFSTGSRGLKEGQVKLQLQLEYLGKKAQLQIDGNVTSIDDDGEGNDYITVQIPMDKVKDVEKFVKQLDARQENIGLFMQKVRGY